MLEALSLTLYHSPFGSAPPPGKPLELFGATSLLATGETAEKGDEGEHTLTTTISNIGKADENAYNMRDAALAKGGNPHTQNHTRPKSPDPNLQTLTPQPHPQAGAALLWRRACRLAPPGWLTAPSSGRQSRTCHS